MAALDAKLAALLAAANGKRRNLIVTADDVEAAIAEASAAPLGIAVRHGGLPVLAKTTLVLAVKVPKRATVVVGIRACWDGATPGRVWKELKPWQQDLAKNAAKAYAWAAVKAPDRVAIAAATTAEAGKATKAAKATSAKPAGAKQAGARQGDGGALLAEILANPEDDHARAVYADHLTLAGDPRGELITAQLAQLTQPTRKSAAAKAALTKQIKALLRKHGAAWTRAAMQDAKECEIRRGFVARVTMTGTAWGAKGARLFATDPIEELVVAEPTAPGLAAIAAAAHTRRLRHLRFSSAFWIGRAPAIAALQGFLTSPAVGAVPRLSLAVMLDGIALPDDFWAALPVHREVRALELTMRPKPRPADVERVFPAAAIRLR